MRIPTRRGRAPEDEAPANEEKAAASGGPAPTAADPLGGVNAKVAKRQRMILAVMGSVVLAAGGSYVISRSDTKAVVKVESSRKSRKTTTRQGRAQPRRGRSPTVMQSHPKRTHCAAGPKPQVSPCGPSS